MHHNSKGRSSQFGGIQIPGGAAATRNIVERQYIATCLFFVHCAPCAAEMHQHALTQGTQSVWGQLGASTCRGRAQPELWLSGVLVGMPVWWQHAACAV